MDAGGQEVLERTAAVVTEGWVELRLQAGLPAAGRRVLGRQAEAMLCGDLPRLAEHALRWENLPQQEARDFVACVENQEQIRAQLDERGLVAFVGDGAILPRESGASDRPLRRTRRWPSGRPSRCASRSPSPTPSRAPTVRATSSRAWGSARA